MRVKSPLKYPGGKQNALKKLIQYVPKSVTEYRDPFVGGGSMAFAISERFPLATIWINDIYEPLVTFWKVLRDHPEALVHELLAMAHDLHTEADARYLFKELVETVHDGSLDDLDTAAGFYFLNKCSFFGPHHIWEVRPARLSPLHEAQPDQGTFLLVRADAALGDHEPRLQRGPDADVARAECAVPVS
jgi:site-specific DNA-adenine methylase